MDWLYHLLGVILKSPLRMLTSGAPWHSSLTAIRPDAAALRIFFGREQDYKDRFQKGFFGYSPLGHERTDDCPDPTPVECFVIGEDDTEGALPRELRTTRSAYFEACVLIAEQIFGTLVTALAFDTVGLSRRDFQFTLQVNFYPSCKDLGRRPTLRMGDHVDPGVMTIFPAGVDGQLEYLNASNRWTRVERSDRVTVIAGKALEFLTGGRIPALRHRVAAASDSHEERFAFPFTIIPRRETRLCRLPQFGGGSEALRGEAFMNQYLEAILTPEKMVRF